MGASKKVNLDLRIQSTTETAEGILLSYIDEGEHPPYSSRELIMRAAFGYYMVFAYCEGRLEQPIKSAVKQQLGRECIASLQQQIREIEQYCRLEPSEVKPDGSGISETISESLTGSNGSSNGQQLVTNSTLNGAYAIESWISDDCF